MLTRRRFLRDIGTGLLIAAAAPVVFERKVWAVPRSAPVRDGAARFSELRTTVRVGGYEIKNVGATRLYVGDPQVGPVVALESPSRSRDLVDLVAAFGIEAAAELDRMARERARAFVRAQLPRLAAKGEGRRAHSRRTEAAPTRAGGALARGGRHSAVDAAVDVHPVELYQRTASPDQAAAARLSAASSHSVNFAMSTTLSRESHVDGLPCMPGVVAMLSWCTSRSSARSIR